MMDRFFTRRPSLLNPRIWALGLIFLALSASAGLALGHEDVKWKQPVPSQCPNLYCWTDTCNVYVLKHGNAAILIDLGDGSVLSHLAEIGVTQIDWVLFTHHHREQCQGFGVLKGKNVSVIPASLQNLKKVCGGVFLGGAAGLTAQPISGV